jgi:hypothetical protein
VLIVLVTWSYDVITKGWHPMDAGTIGVLATLMAGKVIQKGQEGKTDGMQAKTETKAEVK